MRRRTFASTGAAARALTAAPFAFALAVVACNGSVSSGGDREAAGGAGGGVCRDYVTADGYTCCCGSTTCSLTPGCSHAGDDPVPAFGGATNRGGAPGTGGRRSVGSGGASNAGGAPLGVGGGSGSPLDAAVPGDGGDAVSGNSDASVPEGGPPPDAHDGSPDSAGVLPEGGPVAPDATD